MLQKVRVDVEKLIAVSINVLFTTLVGIVFVMVYAFTVHWVIAPVFLLTVPLLGILSSTLSRRIKRIQTEIVRETTGLAGSTTESLRNIELVKSLGLADQEVARLNGTTEKILALELKKVRYLRSLSFIQGTAVNALRTSIMFLMLYLIFTQRITVGQFFSLFIYSFFIFGPLQELGNVINTYRETEVSLQKFQALLDTPLEPRPANPVLIDRLSTLAFEDGRLHAPERAGGGARPASPSRWRAAARSPSSGRRAPGKSTLVKLLVGLYRPQAGPHPLQRALGRGGGPRAPARAHRVRHAGHAAVLGEHPREPALRAPRGERRRVLEALRRAACDSLLARAQKGLDTVIGEAGVKVSGGERQRLSIARALLRNPDLLVFDEATSSLDSITEEEISQTIRDVNHSREAITILIAHRLSTVLHADRIYVLERGRIVEQGRHDDLVTQTRPVLRDVAPAGGRAARGAVAHCGIATGGTMQTTNRRAAGGRW